MLEGWLALGLDPEERRRSLEPQPSPAITALAARGVRSIRPPSRLGDVAAIVIAVKPQVAPDVVPALAPLVGAGHGRGLDHGGQDARASSKRAAGRARSCAPCRTRRPRSAAASRSRCRTRSVTRAQRALAQRLLAAIGAVEWVDDEAPDGRGDRGVGLGPGLCVPARRKPRAGRRRRRPARRSCGAACARDRRRARANCCTARRSMPRRCART